MALAHNAASLHAFAVHQPKDLDALRRDFVDEYSARPVPEIVIADRWTRTRELVERHKTLVPIDPATDTER